MTELHYGNLVRDVKRMNDFIDLYGISAFNAAVYNGAFEKWSFTFLHPHESTTELDGFKAIQRAFINAYT